MNINEQWKHVDETCTYWLHYNQPLKDHINTVTRELLRRTILVDDMPGEAGIYGHCVNSGSWFFYIDIDHGRLTKHHREYIMIEQTIGYQYFLYTRDGCIEMTQSKLEKIMTTVMEHVDKERKQPPHREGFSCYGVEFLLDKKN